MSADPNELRWEDVSDDSAAGGEAGADEGEGEAALPLPAHDEELQREMEAVRIDRHDGRPYCKREFVECYGDDEEWDQAHEVGCVPWACEYCGVTDVESVLQCERTERWFCNGTHGTQGVSHAVLHLALSSQKTLRLHPESKMSAVQMVCFVCGETNLFSVGHVPHATEEDVTLVCCRGCLDASDSEALGRRDQWEPLVHEKNLWEWLAPPPRTQPTHRPLLREAKRLEELWKTSPEACITDIADLCAHVPGEHIPLHFSDGEHYQSVMLPLVKMEAQAERTLCEGLGVKGIDVRWRGNTGAFDFYPYDSKGLSAFDQVKFESDAAPGWSMVAQVIGIERRSACDQRVTVKTRGGTGGKGGARPPPPYNMSLMFNATSYKRVEEVLNKFAVSEAACGDEVYHALLGHGDNSVFDDSLPKNVGSVPGLPELNHSQISAITASLKQPLSLIQGPPGTGKTTTSSAVAYHLARKHGGLLACCPSNIAADHLAERISRTGLRVLRVLSKVKEAEEAVAAAAGGGGSALTLGAHMRTLLAKAPSDGDLSMLTRRRDAGRGLNAREEETLAGEERRCQRELIKSADVIVTTCAAAGDRRLSGMSFGAVLIDEATQATEPELLVPLTRGCKQLVLIGDHCQLGPVVLSQEAKQLGYDRSLFERMVHLGIVPEKLLVQYRMHPALSQWPSGAFYDGALQNGLPEMQRQSDSRIKWPRTDVPMVFIHETCPEELAGSGTSYLNRAEADLVEKNVRALLAADVRPEDIGVITPYDGQRTFVLSRFQRSEASEQLGRVEVASVDAFQGREKDYIVLTCVRSNDRAGLGFLTDPRRLNVSLTRAQRGLILIGNVRSLGKDLLWHSLLQHLSDLQVVCQGSLLDGLTQSSVSIPEPRPAAAERGIAGWVPVAQTGATPWEEGGEEPIPDSLSESGFPQTFAAGGQGLDLISQEGSLSDKFSSLPTLVQSTRGSSCGGGPPSLISQATTYR